MARVHNRGSSAFRRVPRRSTGWSAVNSGTTFTALGANTIILDQVFVPLIPEQTIVRVRGLLIVETDQQTAPEDMLGAFGISLVEEPAATIGVTAVPQPVSDASSESWLVWQGFGATYKFSAGGFFPRSDVQYVIDSKAMRKLNSNQRLAITLQNFHATTGMNYWYILRILSMLKS